MSRDRTVDEVFRNPTSASELERRWSAVRVHMKKQSIDALVVGGSSGVASGYFRWFTGQPGLDRIPRTVIFPLEGYMTLFDHGPTDGEFALDPSQATSRGIDRRFTTPTFLMAVSYTGHDDAEIVAREIKKAGYGKVGLVGPTGMYYAFCSHLKDLLGEARLLDLTEEVDHLRATKSEEEIAFIRQCASMQDDIIDKLRGFIKPGLRDFEVVDYAQYLGHLAGSDQGIFLGSSAAPGTPAMLKSRLHQGRRIQPGDVFMLMIENNGPGGYYTEIMRQFVVGKPPEDLAAAFKQTVDAQKYTLDLLKPGASPSELIAAHNQYMSERGLPEERRLYCHSQGLDLVERPLARSKETIPIGVNMNIAVHPEIATKEFYAIVCDNFLIGHNGPECLHRTPQEIIQL